MDQEETTYLKNTKDATEMDLSPNGKEIALLTRFRIKYKGK